MTLRHSKPKVRKPGQGFVLPDAPPRGPDDMTTFNHLTLTGNVHALALYLGSPETTTIGGELYIVREPRMPTLGRRIPDLLIAFDTDPELYRETNGYVISDQGKPPDFLMEVGSRTTGHIDVGAKRVDYASLNIPEYWRFDETGGSYQGAPLAGDRLVSGEYVPIAIETLEEGVHQGYSAVLDVLIRWTRGRLEWLDPRTGEPVPGLEDERQSRLSAEARLRESQTRVRELEEQLRRARQRD